MNPEIVRELAAIEALQSDSATTPGFTSTLQAIAESAARLLGADRVSLILIDETLAKVSSFIRGGSGWPLVQSTVSYEELLEGLSGWALKTGEMAISPRGQNDPRESQEVQSRRRETLCGAILVAPLGPRGHQMGTLTVINTPEQPDFSELQIHSLRVYSSVITGFIRTARERKLRDEAKAEAHAAVQSKVSFLSNLSHELRTPLNGILGFAQLLGTTKLDTEQQTMLQTILNSGDRLLETVDNLLALAQFETGHFILEPTEFSPRNVLEAIMAPFEAMSRQKSLAWQVEIDPGVSEILVGDPVRLGQAWSHLFSNAVKFTTKGGVLVQLREQKTRWETRELVLVVEDTGIGLPEDRSGKWFKPFFQGDGSLTRKFGGSGLGLALCDRIVRAMHGGVSLFGRPGLGTKARVWVQAAAPQDHPLTTQTLRILLQDHDPISALVVVRTLEEEGHLVDYVASPDGVKRVLESNHYDVFFAETSTPDYPVTPQTWIGLVPWNAVLPPLEPPWSALITRPITHDKLKVALSRCLRGVTA